MTHATLFTEFGNAERIQCSGCRFELFWDGVPPPQKTYYGTARQLFDLGWRGYGPDIFCPKCTSGFQASSVFPTGITTIPIRVTITAEQHLALDDLLGKHELRVLRNPLQSLRQLRVEARSELSKILGEETMKIIGDKTIQLIVVLLTMTQRLPPAGTEITNDGNNHFRAQDNH